MRVIERERERVIDGSVARVSGFSQVDKAPILIVPFVIVSEVENLDMLPTPPSKAKSTSLSVRESGIEKQDIVAFGRGLKKIIVRGWRNRKDALTINNNASCSFGDWHGSLVVNMQPTTLRTAGFIHWLQIEIFLQDKMHNNEKY